MGLQYRILSLADVIRTWPEIAEAVPGVTNLMVVLGSRRGSLQTLLQRIRHIWQEQARNTEDAPSSSRTVVIPTVYGGERAVDLEAVARNADLSPREIVDIHAAGEYTVLTVASVPGFGYLHGLDPRIECPRKATPSLNVEKGSITIGGMLTGVAPASGPSGWHVIGYSDIVVFDPMATPPALLLPGDRVRFFPERILL